jgi:hypothetical protein
MIWLVIVGVAVAMATYEVNRSRTTIIDPNRDTRVVCYAVVLLVAIGLAIFAA